MKKLFIKFITFLKKLFLIFFIIALSSSNVFAAPTHVAEYDVNSEEPSVTGITFNPDGTKMFISGNQHDEINEYSLSVGFDLSSTVTALRLLDVSDQDNAPQDVAFNSDGTVIFVIGKQRANIDSWSLSTAYDLSGVHKTNDLIATTAIGANPRALKFNPDGTKMFILKGTSRLVEEYALSTAYDPATKSSSTNYSVSDSGAWLQGMGFSSNGTKMFIVTNDDDDIHEYNLSTGFDVSTASYVGNYEVNTPGASMDISAMAFNSDGSKMFHGDFQQNDIEEYTLSCYYGVVSCMDPTSDKDDVASIEAQTEAAKKLIQHTTYPILNRMEWLRRNTNNSNLTNQNIKFQFSNTILASLSNLIPAYLNNEATTSELKELETMRDKRKKLISENDELEAQNEKLKLLAKQKEQENKANNWSFWSEGTVSFGRIGDSIISSAKKIKTSAITIGADIKSANNKMFGMAIRLGSDAIDFGNVKNSLDLDTVSLTLYESLLFGKNKFIDSLIGIGTFKTDIVNAVGFSSTDATRDGKQVFASFKVRETFKNNKLNFTPNVKIDLGFSTLSDYSERGTANLKFSRQNIGTIITSIGGTLDNIIDLNGGTLKPFLEMDYYADISPSSEQKMSYTNDTTSTYKLVDIKGSTHNLKGKLGFDFITDTGWTFTSSYQRIQNKGNGYSDGFYLEVNYLPSKDIEYAMSLDNDKASLDYKRNINGLDLTVGSNYSLVSEIPDYGINIGISNTF